MKKYIKILRICDAAFAVHPYIRTVKSFAQIFRIPTDGGGGVTLYCGKVTSHMIGR